MVALPWPAYPTLRTGDVDFKALVALLLDRHIAERRRARIAELETGSPVASAPVVAATFDAERVAIRDLVEAKPRGSCGPDGYGWPGSTTYL